MLVEVLECANDLCWCVAAIFRQFHDVGGVNAVVGRQEVIQVGAPLVFALQVGEVARDKVDERHDVDVAAAKAF